MNIEQEIMELKERNKRVELDKAWETSKTRKGTIALVTYVVIVVFFYIVGINRPFINAIVPTIGFLLSTLSITIVKRIWVKHRQKPF